MLDFDSERSFPPPRDFQKRAMVQIAEGVLAGHTNQMLMAPTGGGKTYLGLRVALKALKQGRRATFLCDRIPLVEQTSAAADDYGLVEHGVIQAKNHPKEDWSQRLQIASVQTIARRKWPDTDVLIVDEAHTMHDTWVEYANSGKAKVIGLSATPFSPRSGQDLHESD